MSVTIPETSEVITLPTFTSTADILASLQSAIAALKTLLTNYNPGGVTETFLEGCALALGNDASTYPGVTAPGAYENLVLVQNAAFILTATGTDLDLKCADVGVYRKPATEATGPLLFGLITPSNTDTVVAVGTLVSADPADPTANPVIFTTLAAVTIPAGQSTAPNTVLGEAVNAGTSGNQIPGAVTRVVSAANLTVTNPASISGGTDTEQDDSPNGGLRARGLSAIADASQGTIAAIENDAKSFAGVTDAVLIENTADDGVTVQDGRGQLYIDDGSGNLGSTENSNNAVIAEVQQAFDSGLYRAAGTQVHVVGSLLLPVTLALYIQVNRQYTLQTASLASVVAAVQLAVYNYVNSIGIGKPVLVAEIIRYAAGVSGVSNVPAGLVTIGGVAGDLTPLATEVPRCAGLASITVSSGLVDF